MPIYSMQNQETEEIFEVVMPYADLASYLEQNPTIKQIFNKFPGHADPHRMGLKKVDDGFNDLLSRIKRNNLHSTIETRK